jgi:membrane-bound serine protease (ClpP class)
MHSLFAFFWAMGVVLGSPVQADKAVAPLVIEARVEGAITPATASYLKEALQFAEKSKASAFLITLDTPGGLLEATREIVQDMLAAKVPTLVYVSPSGARAGSAGVFITLAADVAGMAPGTHIGAAHPVGPMGGDIEGDMKKKIENDAAAWARSLAQNQGRNANWAEKAVRESASIPVQEALKEHVIDFIADDTSAFLTMADGRTVLVGNEKQVLHVKGAQVKAYEMSSRHQLVQWLSNPNLLYLLMLLGFLGLFIEFQFPGVILPGLLGVLCLALVFGVQILPVNWLGVLLVLGAVALFIAEIYITSFGLLSLGGIALFIAGSYLLFDVPGSSLGVEPTMIWILAFTFALIFLAIGYVLLRAKRQGPTSSTDAMKGEVVRVYERITPETPGTVELQGSFWTAHAKETFEPGDEVVVDHLEGAQVYVTKAK